MEERNWELPRVSMIPPKQPGEGEKLNVTAYCRVSTDLEEQQYSYHQQLEYYSGYISSHAGWNFIGIYADEGLSGTSMKKRANFNQMLKDAAEGKIDYILVKSISRFARNTVDALSCIRKLKTQSPPVGVYFEKENIDTLDSQGELILTIMSALAQDESRSISENVKWSLQKKFQNGEDVTNLNTMLGYDWGERKEWVINEKQADVVRYIFRRYLDGIGTTRIARELMDRGFRTGRGNSVWRGGGVHRILSNEKYAGDALLQKTIVRDFLAHVSELNDGSIPSYYVQNHHVPIIDRATWNAVQAEMEKRRERPIAGIVKGKEKKEKYSGKWPMSSKLCCGKCGRKLIRRTYRMQVRDEERNLSARRSGLYFTYPVWRCQAADGGWKDDSAGDQGEAAERKRCDAASYLEVSLKQSFMEFLYLLKKQSLMEMRESEDGSCRLWREFEEMLAGHEARLLNPLESERLEYLEEHIRDLETRYREVRMLAEDVERGFLGHGAETAGFGGFLADTPEWMGTDAASRRETGSGAAENAEKFCGERERGGEWGETEGKEQAFGSELDELLAELAQQLDRKRREYNELLEKREDSGERKRVFLWFFDELMKLPDTNTAGEEIRFLGWKTYGEAGADGETERKEEREEKDMIPFAEEVFRRIILQGTVMDDGRIAYQTRMGLTFVVVGNGRRFADFYGSRRAVREGEIQKIARAEEVVEAGIRRMAEKKAGRKKKKEKITGISHARS